MISDECRILADLELPDHMQKVIEGSMSDKDPKWINAARVLIGALVVYFLVGKDYVTFGGESPYFFLLLLPIVGFFYWMFVGRSYETDSDGRDDISPAERVRRLQKQKRSQSGSNPE